MDSGLDLDFGFVDGAFFSGFILKGLLFSIELTLVAMIGGIAIGTALATMRLSHRRLLAWPAAVYVDTLRSIPLVMVILWVYLLLPFVVGRPIGAEPAAFVTFTLFEAAYYSEIMRAGIASVSAGQLHAGYAVGLSHGQTMGRVVLPQAFRNMLPVLLTQTIVLFQDTSLVYAIGAYDLFKGFDVAAKNFQRPVEAYLLAAVVYFAICFSLSRAVRRLHRRVAIVR